MGFLQKIKDIFGIGGVKIKLQVPAELNKKDTQLKGKVTVTSKSDKDVAGIKVDMKEVYQTGKGDNKKTQEFELGEVQVTEAFQIKTGETKEFDFTLKYQLLKSKNDELKDKGGMVGKLGSLGKFMDAEKSNYWVGASAEVKGTVFGPTDTQEVKIK